MCKCKDKGKCKCDPISLPSITITGVSNSLSGYNLTTTVNSKSSSPISLKPAIELVAWSLTGNSGTTAGTNFIGTTDAVDLVFKANNSEAFRVKNSNKFIGFGESSPLALGHFKSSSDTGIRVETNVGGSYTGKKFEYEVGGGQWGLGFSASNNAMTFLTTGSSSGNFIFGYGTESGPTARMYYNSTFGGFCVNVTLGSIDAIGHFKMPSVGNPTDKILLAQTSGGTNHFIVYNDGKISTAGLQVGNAGLSSGDLYVDTAANVLANGDKVVARKV